MNKRKILIIMLVVFILVTTLIIFGLSTKKRVSDNKKAKQDIVTEGKKDEIKNIFTITFDCNKGKGNIEKQIVKYGELFSLTELTCDREGYIQDGWLDDNNKIWRANEYNNKKWTYKNDVVLHANWIKKNENIPGVKKYKITYDCHGGINAPRDQIVTENQKFSLTKSVCSKNGYVQDGWLDDNNKIWRANEYNNKKWTYKNDVVLHANWVKRVSRIHFTNIYTYEKASSAEAILIESNGHYGLIDASNPINGPYPEWNYKLYNGTTVSNYIKKNYKNSDTPHLDFIITTHAHSDHTGGVPLLYESGLINSKTVYIYKKFSSNNKNEIKWNTNYYYNEALKTINNASAKKIIVNGAKTSNLGSLNAKFVSNGGGATDYIVFNFHDLNIKIFNTKNASNVVDNDNSLIVLITRGNKKLLLLSESNSVNKIQQSVANYVGHVNFEKAGHYNSQGYLPLRTLNATTPDIMLLTGARSGKAYNGDLGEAIAYYNENSGIILGNEDMSSPLVVQIDPKKITLYNNDYGTYKSITPSKYLKANASPGWQKIVDTGKSENIEWTYISNNTHVKGWKKINGKWYYFQEKSTKNKSAGVMLKGWQNLYYAKQKSWYYFDDKGAMKTGWLKYNNKWYYLNSKGVMLTGTQTINGEKFVFDANGVCIQGRGC